MSKKAIIIKPADHDAWLKAREDGIGASEVAAILGLSPFETPFSLWLKKTKQILPEPENEAMLMGHLLEEVVAKRWEMETGEKVIKASAADIIYVHPEYDYMRATPDRIVRGRKKLLECKTTLSQVDETDPPIYWVAQVIYQMYVTGIHDADLAWLVSGRFFGYAHIPYDPEFAEFIAERVSHFWNDCVKGGKEPDLISVGDYAIKGSTPGSSTEADSQAVADIKDLRRIRLSLAEKEQESESLKDKLKLYMGESESLTLNGKVLATWKSGTKNRTFLLKDKNIDELFTETTTLDS